MVSMLSEIPATGAPATTGDASPRARAAYAWYVLAVLFIANAFNAMDRSIVTILVEPIKRDLGLNDTEIGVITGLGYALVYTLVGLAIAGIVNHGDRRRTLSVGVAFWSVMTALTGYTTGFGTMLAARFGIAAGEATCYPNALSLIGDYFERAKRSRAIALFHLGTYAGIIVGVSSAGVIAAHQGWRAAFRLLGLPGLILAVVIWLTIREPVRGMTDDAAAAPTAVGPGGASLSAMWRLLTNNARFAWLVAAAVMMTLVQAMLGSWVPAFLMRLHGVSQVDVGLLAGPVIGVSGIAGTLIGGVLGTRAAQRDSDDELAPLRIVLATAPLSIPALLLFLFAPTLFWTLAGGALAVFFISIHFGPMVAVTIGVVGAHNRGIASSLLTAGQFLVGFGIGPLVVGGLSDLLQPSAGAGSLRFALLLAPAAAAIACGFAAAGYRRRTGADDRASDRPALSRGAS